MFSSQIDRPIMMLKKHFLTGEGEDEDEEEGEEEEEEGEVQMNVDTFAYEENNTHHWVYETAYMTIIIQFVCKRIETS